MNSPISSDDVAVNPMTPGAPKHGRVLFFDAIRACAMVCVVLIHVASGVFHSARLGSFSWWTADFFDSFARPCVPLFLMASGALLLGERRDDHPESVRDFFKKRVTKVVLPFVFWAAIYILWRIAFHHEPMSGRFLVSQVWSGNVYMHLWFIYTILGLYLVTPILRVLVRHAAPDTWKLFFVLWVLFSSIFPLVARATGVESGIQIPLATGYVGYFLLGFYLYRFHDEKTKAAPLLLKIAFLTFFTTVATFVLCMKKGALAESFLDYLSPNVALTSFYAFLWFRDYDWRSLLERAPLLGRLIALLSSASLGIYFVHVIVLQLLDKGLFSFATAGRNGAFVLVIPTMTLLTTFASLIIVLAMKKTPILKVFVP